MVATQQGYITKDLAYAQDIQTKENLAYNVLYAKKYNAAAAW